MGDSVATVAAFWNDTALDIETFSGAIDIFNKLPAGCERTWKLMHGSAFIAYKAYGTDQDDDIIDYLELVDKLDVVPRPEELVEAELAVLQAIGWNVPARSLAQRASALLLKDGDKLAVSLDHFEYSVALASVVSMPEWANIVLKTHATACLARGPCLYPASTASTTSHTSR